MKTRFLLLVALPAFMFLYSCDKGIGDDEKKSREPGVYDFAVSNVGLYSAKLEAKLTVPEQVGIDFELGFELSESNTFPKESTNRYRVKSYNPDKSFSCDISDLEVNVTYYARAYMINQVCLYTSQQKSFTTKNVRIETGDVDLKTYSVRTQTNIGKDPSKYIVYGVRYGVDDGFGSVAYYGHVTTETVDDDDSYEVTLDLELIPYGTVYYQSCVTINGATFYGDVKTFEYVYEYPVPDSDSYVDLGLSVKWATCNIGASKPEEYGDYFAWGATEPLYKLGYAQSDNPIWKSGKSGGYTYVNTPYQTANTTDWYSVKYTKYLGSTTSSYKDPSATNADAMKTVLDPEDDAAHVNWGGDWRMPTKAEQDELRNNCTWTRTTINGIKGYKVQSNKSGYTDRWIFLPAAGFRGDTDLYYVGFDGGYWSSSLCTGRSNSAYYLYFYFDPSDVGWGEGDRNFGHPVRPVCH